MGNDNKTPFHINFAALHFGEKIGAGSYGEVFKGTYLMSPVAVKVFHINLKSPSLSTALQQDQDEGAIGHDDGAAFARMSTMNALKRYATTNSQAKYQEFVHEVRLMSLVRHPNLVLYMGACGDAFTPLCIVSELFTGGSLHEFLHTDADFIPSVSTAMSFALSIARGMHYLHSSSPSIFHRDLKARNVLLNGQEGDDGAPRVVICDFGLCQLFGEGGKHGGHAMGTSAYMSPDVICGGVFGAADDVYSYGVLLHEIFTGCVPFKGMRALEIIYQVDQNKLRPVSDRDGAIPESVLGLIEDCWHADRSLRPAFDAILLRLEEIAIAMKSASRAGRANSEL